MRSKTLNQAAAARQRPPRRTPVVIRAISAAAIAVVGAALFGAWTVFGGWLLAAVAVICLVAAGAGSWDLFSRTPVSLWLPLTVIVALAWLGAAVGGTNMVQIGDTVYPSWSQPARVFREAVQLRDALGVITRADLMTTADLGQVRTEQERYSQTVVTLKELSERFRNEPFSDVQLVEAAQSVATAADAAAQAVDAHRMLAVQYGVRLVQERDRLRTTTISEALRAGRLIESAVVRAGLPTGVTE